MRRDRKLRKLVVAHNRAERTALRAAVRDEAIEKLRDRHRLWRQVDSAIACVERLTFRSFGVFARAKGSDALAPRAPRRIRSGARRDALQSAQISMTVSRLPDALMLDATSPFAPPMHYAPARIAARCEKAVRHIAFSTLATFCKRECKTGAMSESRGAMLKVLIL